VILGLNDGAAVLLVPSLGVSFILSYVQFPKFRSSKLLVVPILCVDACAISAGSLTYRRPSLSYSWQNNRSKRSFIRKQDRETKAAGHVDDLFRVW
jgi:hypothetical protein